ncbi:DNA glycosylase AlkZ-like family protein [Demequina litorisediminis]|nr:crosslink repair DNA glycosylase YcaQ family protein [Demequina litorisediminis]
MLSAVEVQSLRMRALRLDGTREASVHDIVTWCGAMQAQDLASGLWSLGMRLAAGTTGATQADVEAALERREALRTWPMRGTVHLVPPEDASLDASPHGREAPARCGPAPRVPWP